jgi:hypothetical protein
VHADPTRKRPIAIIVPDKAQLSDLLQASILENEDVQSTQDSLAILRQLALHQLQQQAQTYGLTSIETIDAVVLSHLPEWGPLNVSFT